jgi:hypothetical protein
MHLGFVHFSVCCITMENFRKLNLHLRYHTPVMAGNHDTMMTYNRAH